MEISIPAVVYLVVAVLTYIVAEVLKVFAISNKYIPLVNIGVGIIAGVIIYFCKLCPDFSAIYTFGMALVVALGTGGFYDTLNSLKKITAKE